MSDFKSFMSTIKEYFKFLEMPGFQIFWLVLTGVLAIKCHFFFSLFIASLLGGITQLIYEKILIPRRIKITEEKARMEKVAEETERDREYIKRELSKLGPEEIKPLNLLMKNGNKPVPMNYFFGPSTYSPNGIKYKYFVVVKKGKKQLAKVAPSYYPMFVKIWKEYDKDFGEIEYIDE